MSRAALVVCSLAALACAISCGGGSPQAAPTSTDSLEDISRYRDVNPFGPGEVVSLLPQVGRDFVLVTRRDIDLVDWVTTGIERGPLGEDLFEMKVEAVRLPPGTKAHVLASDPASSQIVVVREPGGRGEPRRGFVMSLCVNREARLTRWRRDNGR